MRELVEATAQSEEGLRSEVHQTCDYVRAGPHRGTYRLKPTYRTVTCAAPEPYDGLKEPG